MRQNQIKERNLKKNPLFSYGGIHLEEDGIHIVIKSKTLSLVLDTKKGMAIESLIFPETFSAPLIVTVPQGYYQDNNFNADFFSGHTTLDIPGLGKITDLSPVKPSYAISFFGGEKWLAITGIITFDQGTLQKTVFVAVQSPKIKIEYVVSPLIPPRCSFRAGFMTFNPEVFDTRTLFYSCHNGGFKPDMFFFGTEAIHVHPVSFLVSSRRALGNTSGILEVGDKSKTVTMAIEMDNYAALPMLQFEKMLRSSTFFLRTKFSLQEFDDTTIKDRVSSRKPIVFRLTISAQKNNA